MTSCKTIPKSHEKKKNLWAKLMAFFFTLPAVKMQYIFFSVQRIVFLSRQFRMQHTHSVMSPLLLFKKKTKKTKKKTENCLKARARENPFPVHHIDLCRRFNNGGSTCTFFDNFLQQEIPMYSLINHN